MPSTPRHPAVRRHSSRGTLVAALLAAGVFAGCVQRDACNDECAPDEVCDAELLACVPVGFDGGGTTDCTRNSDCPTAARPVCEVDSGRCVQCTNGVLHCPTGRCDPLTLTCLGPGCTRPEDCANEAGKPFCASDGTCVECRAAVDCPPLDGKRRTCNITDRVCVVKPCTTASDCVADAGGRVCDVNTGLCVSCTEDGQCTGFTNRRCSPATKTCVACVLDEHCDESAGQTCDPATSKCKVTGCVQDWQCNGSERCHAQSRRCVPCLEDGDCVHGGVCGEALHCVDAEPCAGDSGCVWPRTCRAGTCSACGTHDDCPGAQTCQDGSCVEPLTCTGNEDCFAGRVCREGACAESQCAADPLEPNDSLERASAVEPGTLDAVLCPNEVDWLALKFQAGAGAEVVLRYDAAHGEPELQLLWGGDAPAVVATGAPRGQGVLRAVVEEAASGRGPLYVRLAQSGPTAIPYRLETRVVAGGLCENDDREPDDGQLQAQALAPGTHLGVLCPGESDWISMDVAALYRPIVGLHLGDQPRELAEIRIFALAGGTLRQVGYGFDTARARPVDPSVAQTYWIQLTNQSQRKLPYGVELQVGPLPPANDGCAAALVLPHNARSQGTTLGADPDGGASCGSGGGDVFWLLRLTEPSAVSLVLDATFHGALSLQGGCGGVELGCAASTTSLRQLRFDGLPAGDWVVRVEAVPGQQGSFVLDTTVESAPLPPAGTSCESPETLALGGGVSEVSRSGNLALASDEVSSPCGASGREAVYAFTLNESRRVVAELDAFPGASLTLVAEGQCGSAPAGACAVGSAAAPSRVVIDRTALAAGTYRLVVDGGSHRTGGYTLRLRTEEPIPTPSNDVCEDAAPLGAVELGDTRAAADAHAPVCGSSAHAAADVVYRLELTETEDVLLELEADFDAVLSLTAGACGAEQPRACSDLAPRRLEFPALAPGTYHVWVDGYLDAAGRFRLQTTRSVPEPLPANDLCEDAMLLVPGGAPLLVSGSTRRATDSLSPACLLGLSGNDVSFAVDVPAGKTLAVRLAPTSPGFDPALYLLSACDAAACLDGSDRFDEAEEELAWTNAGPDPRRVLVVVDSWRQGEEGTFSLEVELRAE